MATTQVTERAIHRVVNLIPDEDQVILNLTLDEARQRLLREDLSSVLDICGSYALVAREGERVCLARSLNRPLR